MTDDTKSVSGIVDNLRNVDDDQPTIGKIVDAFGDRSFGPLITVPALVSLSPLGAIPGASAVIALILVLIASQLLTGRERPWLPGFIKDRALSDQKFEKTIDRLADWSDRIDSVLHERLKWMVSSVAARCQAVAIVVLAMSFLPVILIPWGVVVPSLIIALFGLSLLARDGYTALLGWLLCPLWVWLFWSLYPG